MANKKDLTEAQNYSRARLVTAFDSGIPDGKELTPKRGLTPVVVGVGLTAIIILISVFYGMMNPGLPSDWSNNKLIVARDTASRFVSIDGTLYPVINTTSARLLIPAKDYEVIIVDDAELEGIPVGGSIGIVGAPDILPNRSRLVSKHMASCLHEGEIRNIVTDDAVVRTGVASAAALVTVAKHQYLIANRVSHRLPDDELLRASVLRLLGVGELSAVDAPQRWLDLFRSGSDLGPIEVPESGSRISVNGDEYTVGSVIAQEGDDATRYVVMADSSLVPLQGIALDLYTLGKDRRFLDTKPVSVRKMSGFGNAEGTFIPSDWPTGKLNAQGDDATTCAAVTSDGSALGTVADKDMLTDNPSHTTVRDGAGALIRTVSGTDTSQGTLYVIDGGGTAYAVTDDDSDTLARLGYQQSDITVIPRAWANVLSMGVSLSKNAAGMQVTTQSVDSADSSGGNASTADRS